VLLDGEIPIRDLPEVWNSLTPENSTGDAYLQIPDER